jgi:acyl dehydratase
MIKAMTEAETTGTFPLRVPLDHLETYVGQTLGQSPWHEISQARVDQFADATEDHQWIHVDPIRAKDGPFGQTIAHGYLTLSLAPVMLFEVLTVDGAALVINYGANRVRFPSTVPVGSRVRATVELMEVTEVKGGLQAAFQITFEVAGTAKPVCVAEILFRFYRPAEG